MLRLTAALILAFFSAPAFSQSHPSDLMKEPWIRAKWSQAIKGANLKQWDSWIRDLNGVGSGPDDKRDASGKSWTVAQLCQPHDCADNNLAVIIDRQNRNLWGLLLRANPTSRKYFGNPGPEAKAILEAVFHGSLANVRSRSTGVVAAEQDDSEVLLNTLPEPQQSAPARAASQSVPAAAQDRPPREQPSADPAVWRYGNHPLFGLSAHVDVNGESVGLACGFRGTDLMRADSVLFRITRGLSPDATKPSHGIIIVEGTPYAGTSLFTVHARSFLEEKENACGVIQALQRGKAIHFPEGIMTGTEFATNKYTLTLKQRGIEKKISGDRDLHKLVDTRRIPLTGAAKAIRQLINACPAIRADFRNDCGV